MPDIDPATFRQVLGHFPTGVVVATAIDDGQPAGMAVGSFTSVSLDPPLVAFFPDKTSTSFPKIRSAGAFCINVLTGEQEQVCRAFAARGANKYEGLHWRPAGSGAPIVDSVLAWIDCDLHEVLEAGDHYIVLGRVRDLAVEHDSLPLVFFRGGYGQFAPTSLVAPAEPDLLAQLRVMDRARPEMEAIAAELDVECFAVTVVGDEVVTLGSAGKSFGDTQVERLGQRIPFVPPLCSLFVAWQGPDAFRAWVGRLDPAMAPDAVEQYRRMTETVRRRGWSLALASRAHISFELAVAQLSAIDPTDDQLDAVRAAARQLGHGSHEPAEIAPDGTYRVRNLSGPVFDRDGKVALMLTIIGLPTTLTGRDIERYVERVVTGADRATTKLGGRRPIENAQR